MQLIQYQGINIHGEEISEVVFKHESFEDIREFARKKCIEHGNLDVFWTCANYNWSWAQLGFGENIFYYTRP